jgi:hypothetical protein
MVEGENKEIGLPRRWFLPGAAIPRARTRGGNAGIFPELTGAERERLINRARLLLSVE